MITTPAAAQTATGSLRGVVQDASGGRIASAHVSVSKAGALPRETEADRRGEFHLSDLAPGVYDVTVDAQGFAPAHAGVTVVVSRVQDVTVTLQPIGVQQSVTVSAAPSSITSQPLDMATAVHQGTVTAADLASIPLTHRSFANIAYLVPGTEPVEPSDPTKARITAVSFGGSSGLNVDLSVDGGDNTDDYIGGFLQDFSPEAIQEFTVETSQEEVVQGRTVGGAVVITTKSGTNQWLGSGSVYDRPSTLNARYPIDNPPPAPKQDFSRENYVGTIGGPLVQKKAWLFMSSEYVNEHASIAYSPDSLTQFNALATLASEGLIPGVPSIAVPSSVAVPYHEYLGTWRVDFTESPSSRWFVRAAVDDYMTTNDLVQQATLPSTGATSRSRYLNTVLNNTRTFGTNWVGTFTFDVNDLHHTEDRNSNDGFALAFPFSATFQTISGFETFGDNQFATPITAFPVLRNQEKFQFRYDLTHQAGSHTQRFGVNFIHEPVLSGALSGTAEDLHQFPLDPTAYLADPQQFVADYACAEANGVQPSPDAVCSSTPASDGSFSQDVQRLGLYVQDSWRIRSRFTLNAGLRYDTTFGLFEASGRSQLDNPAFLTMQALQIPLVSGVPHDYRKAIAPRIGIAYALGAQSNTVLRAGTGLYYNDLAQNGWVNAFQAVNSPPGRCIAPGDPGCIPGGGQGAVIDSNYQTPRALQSSAGVEHSFSHGWLLEANWTQEKGSHAYRAYNYTAGVNLFAPPGVDQSLVPNMIVYRTDNRSMYNALSVHLQGNVSSRLNLVANYTLAKAQTWGCTVGELFDYVNGVCDPLNAFAPGDYGPSGEDVRHRFVLAATAHAPAGLVFSTLTQAESARPFTLANGDQRAVINGVETTLDEFRGTPFVQVDLRVSRPVQAGRASFEPFVEFFNLLNRNNPANNYVTDVGALNVPPRRGGQRQYHGPLRQRELHYSGPNHEPEPAPESGRGNRRFLRTRHDRRCLVHRPVGPEGRVLVSLELRSML